jgi:predicted P-loop ATPase
MMQDEMVTIYITKYALTQGIYQARGRICHEVNDSMVQVIPEREGMAMPYYLHGRDWWRTPEEARLDAERRRQEAIKTIEKKLARLKSMTFKIKVRKAGDVQEQ